MILYLGHRIFGALSIACIAGFKGRKMNKFIPDRKYIAIHQSISLNQSEKVLLQISGQRRWREFLEVFYFPSDFIVVAETF